MKNAEILNYQLFMQRERDFLHEPASSETNFYSLIVNGDTETIKANQEKYSGMGDEQKGSLSSNPLRNQIYHFIINTAVIARICESNGLPRETAYTMSDIYIRKVDECENIQAVKNLNDEMVLFYAEKMHNLKRKIISKPVRLAINCIDENLHKKITTAKLAEIAKCNRSYLCIIFKDQIGKSINNYITEKRLDVAKNMLLTEEFSISDIAFTLAFPSQSYFCKVFKNYTARTPREFISFEKSNKII